MKPGAAGVAAAGLAMASCVAPRASAPKPVPALVTAPPAQPPAPPPQEDRLPSRATFALTGALSQGGLVRGLAPSGAVSLTLDGVAVPLGSGGVFLIGFGRDHGPAATLSAALDDGRVVSETLAIAPRAWRIESLPIPKYQQPAAEFLKIRAGELEQIKAARTAAATVQSDGWRETFQWPATARVSGLFGAQRVYKGEKGSFHSGIDLAVPQGTPVRAPAGGVVLLAVSGAPFTLEGHLLIVGHGMGLDSAFLHLSHIDVQRGDVVRQGQVIGESGMTGRATGPHLHWALTWRGERLDPLLVAGPVPGQPGEPPAGGSGD